MFFGIIMYHVEMFTLAIFKYKSLLIATAEHVKLMHADRLSLATLLSL